jgi:hypothetical protein
MSDIFTIGDIVRLTGADLRRVEYAIRSRAVQPIRRAGSANLYDRAGVEQIEQALAPWQELMNGNQRQLPAVDAEDRERPVLDMHVSQDRAMLAEAIRRGWQISPERKRRYFDALDRVVENIDQIADPSKRAQAAAQCARVLVAEQSAAIRDLHHTERMQHEAGILDLRMRRAEEGKPNDLIEHRVQMTPVRELPMPAWMLGMRKRLLEPSES